MEIMGVFFTMAHMGNIRMYIRYQRLKILSAKGPQPAESQLDDSRTEIPGEFSQGSDVVGK